MKSQLQVLLAACALVAIVNPAAYAVQKADDPAAAATNETLQPDWRAKLGASSSSFNDILKLAKSGVDESVILSFVQNSSVAYNPGADEIIKLREAGISSQVITAMITHGAELRAASAKAQQQYAGANTQPAPAAGYPATTTYAVPATYAYAAPASQVIYYPSYPTYTYSVGYYGSYGGCYYPRYSYCYPRYSYCYPRSYCYPSYSCYPRTGFYFGARGSHYSVGVSHGGIAFGGTFGGHGHHR